MKKVVCLVLAVFFIGSVSNRLIFSQETGEEASVEALARVKAKEQAGLRLIELNKESAEDSYREGREFYRKKAFAEARESFQQVLKINPEHKEARKYLRKAQDKLSKLTAKEIKAKQSTKAREKELEINQQAKKHLEKGQEYHQNQEFDRAVKEWEKIFPLVSSPYNSYYRRAQALIIATRKDKLLQRERQAEWEKDIAYETRALEIEKNWLRPPEKEKRAEDRKEISRAKAVILEKAAQPVSLNFENAHVREVLRFLSEASGVGIVLDEAAFPIQEEEIALGEEESAGTMTVEEEQQQVSPQVTLRLKDVPMLEALHAIARIKNLQYRIEDNVIWVTNARILAREEFITKIFHLSSGPGAIEQILADIISWPEGSALSINQNTGRLVVTNSPGNMEVIEEVIDALDAPPIQIAIEVQIVEIYGDNLSILGVDWEETTDGPHFSPLLGDEVTADLDFNWDSYHMGRWLGGSPIKRHVGEGLLLYFDKFSVRGFLRALVKEGKANLLSSPSITVLNNQEATIRIIEPLYYPESFTAEEETSEDVNVGGEPISRRRDTLTATDFQQVDIGVTLTVTPSVGGDRKTIYLRIEPETIEHLGWTTFLNVSRGNDDPPGPQWVVIQPSFFTRNIQSNMIIGDGETVVLGGLISEEKLEDVTKVPLLGDIPGLGFFFRTTIKTSFKRNLMVFVTARILTPAGEALTH